MRMGLLVGLLAVTMTAGAALAAPVTGAAPSWGPMAQPVASLSNSTVLQIQDMLAMQGYYTGPLDGVLGSKTRAAVRAYESAHGLPVTGDPFILAQRLQTAVVPVPAAPQVVVVPRPVPVVRAWPRTRHYGWVGRPVIRFYGGHRRWR